jgi:hypothetical protein
MGCVLLALLLCTGVDVAAKTRTKSQGSTLRKNGQFVIAPLPTTREFQNRRMFATQAEYRRQLKGRFGAAGRAGHTLPIGIGETFQP